MELTFSLFFSAAISQAAAAQWPPEDPAIAIQEEHQQPFSLPDSPWTYENGSLNPNLRPTSAAKRKAKAKSNNVLHSSLPPYHPDYVPPGPGDTDRFMYSSSSDEDEDGSSGDEYYAEEAPTRPMPIRRGSEGYEVRPIDREAMLRRYIEGQTAEVGRYNLYVPEPDVDSESDGLIGGDGDGSEGEDEVPLAKKVENWIAGTGTTTAD